MVKREILKEMLALLENEIVSRHSLFQLKFFLLGKEYTTQSKLWRCLTELKSRKEAMVNLELEQEETVDQIRLLEIQKEKFSAARISDPLDVEENQIKIRQIERKIKSFKLTQAALASREKFNLQEADFFIQAFKSLEQVEALKPYDDLESQQEYWDKKIEQEINLKVLLRQPLDAELIKTTLCLGNKSAIREKVIDMLEIDGKTEDFVHHKLARKRTVEEDRLLQNTRIND